MEHQRVQRTSNWSPTFQKRSSPSNDEPPKTVHKKTTSASPSEQLVVDKSPDPSDWLQQDPMIQQIIASDPVLGKILQQDWQPSISTEGKADTDAVGQNAVGQESIQLKRANNPTGEDSVQVQTSQLQQDSNNGSLPEVRKVANQEKSSASKIQQVAATGFRGSAASLPHLNQIQHSFGVDLSGVQAYVGGDAAAACQRMGAQAYASGNQIAFKEQPSLELAAHEAAHIVQQASGKVQLAGGVGQVGDKYENHADAVAAKVAAGESAVPLLRDFSETNSGEKQSQGRSPTDQHLTSSELSQTIENPLDQATRLIDLGVSNYYKGNYYEALKNFEKALELDPNNSRGWYNRGLPLGRLNLFKDAIDSYNKALRTDTNWGVSQPSSAWNNIGVSWYYLGEFNKSIQAFKKALEVDPNYKLAQKNHSILETLLSNNPFLRNQNQQTARPFTGEKPITSDPSWQQIVKDLLASVVQSPLHAGDVLGDIFEYLQEHWQQFVWTTVGLIAAQTSVAVLTGIPEPTFLSKVLAVALQSFLFAVYGVTIVVSVDAAINELKNWWNAASTANGNPEAIAEASRALLRMVGYILILIISSKQFQGNEKWVRLQAMLARRPEVPRGLPPGGPTIVLNKDPVTGVYRLADPNAQNPSSLPPSNRPGVNPPIQLPTRPPGGSGRSSTLTPPVTGLATPGGSTPPAPTGQIPDGGLTLKPEDRSTSIPPPPTGPATPGRSTPPASTGGIPNRGLPRKAEVRSPQVPHTSSQPVIVEELTPQTSPDPVTPNSTTFTTLPPPPASGISFRPRVTEGQERVPSSQSGPSDRVPTPAPGTTGSLPSITGVPLTTEEDRGNERPVREAVMVNALGENHEFKLLPDGTIIRCSEDCKKLAESVRQELRELSNSQDKDVSTQAETLRKRASTLIEESSNKARSEDELLDDILELEKAISALKLKVGLEQTETKVDINQLQSDLSVSELDVNEVLDQYGVSGLQRLQNAKDKIDLNDLKGLINQLGADKFIDLIANYELLAVQIALNVGKEIAEQAENNVDKYTRKIEIAAILLSENRQAPNVKNLEAQFQNNRRERKQELSDKQDEAKGRLKKLIDRQNTLIRKQSSPNYPDLTEKELEELATLPERIEKTKTTIEEIEKLLPEAKILDRDAQYQAKDNPFAQIDKRINTSRWALLPCFSGETLIWTADGVRRIDELHIGELVFTFDFERQEVVKRAILQVLRNKTNHFYEIRVGNDIIKATGNHLFWIEDKSVWLAARELKAGMYLKILDGQVTQIDSILLREGIESETYNLSIAQNHNYFVGSGVLVHNEGAHNYDFGESSYKFIIYHGKNKNFPNRVYVGQTDPDQPRLADHRREAKSWLENNISKDKLVGVDNWGEQEVNELIQNLRNERPLTDEQGKDVRYYIFKKNMELEVKVTGLSAKMADWLEQKNMDIQKDLLGENNVMNRRNEITTTKEEVYKAVMAELEAINQRQGTTYCK